MSGHLQFLIILYVKKGNVACSSSWNSPQNYGTPLVNGIRQCYLPPDRADRPAFWPRYVLFCIIMSIVFVKFTKIQYLQSCLCRKFHLFLRKSTKKIIATRAAPFGPDMHQIVSRLRLCLRPHWVSLHRSPRPLAALRGGPLGKGREKKGGKGKWDERMTGEAEHPDFQTDWRLWPFPMTFICVLSLLGSLVQYKCSNNTVFTLAVCFTLLYISCI